MLEPVMQNITWVLESQRMYRKKLDNTKDIRPISDRNRETFIAELPHHIPYFAMRAFSLPIDYRVPKERLWTKEMYHDFVDAIVIQPEYLPDDFLLSLGLMSEEETKWLSLTENIAKKISLIPAIKNLLHTLVPLRIWERKTTGRISRVWDPNHPNYGWYIVFQELTEIDDDREVKRRSMRRKIVPHFYKDHYSLIRSQRYASEKLRKKIVFLWDFRNDVIPTLLLRWQRVAYTIEEKQRDVATLIGDLEWSLAYHERRALEDRIQKIDFQNPEHDRQRLIWACNDIIKAIEDKLGKQNEISAQTDWLRDSERQVRSAFEPFYEEAMLHIPALNQALHGVEPRDMSLEENLRGNQTHAINAYLKIIERFYERLSALPEVGKPYHTLPWLMSGFLESMNLHRKQRKWAIGKEWIRLLLSFLLELKKIRFHVMNKEAEYRIKVRWDGMSRAEKLNLKSKVDRVRDSLEHTRFLPDIELTLKWQDLFAGMIGELMEIAQALTPLDPSDGASQ